VADILEKLQELPLYWRIIIQVCALIITLALAWAANKITKRFILGLIQGLIKRTKTQWDDAFLKNRVFQLCSHIDHPLPGSTHCVL
jgi:hypothetical protein